jgi:hypothetical protein
MRNTIQMPSARKLFPIGAGASATLNGAPSARDLFPIGPEPHRTVPDRNVYAVAIGLLIAAVVLVLL